MQDCNEPPRKEAETIVSYAKLRGRIREKYGTQAAFAEALNMAQSTLSAKLGGTRDWARQEIETTAKLLDIPGEELHAYFFTP